MTDDDEYYRRVALHGSISDDDCPDDIQTTDEELDAVIEIVYFRPDDQYGVYERHIRSGALHLQHEWPMDEFANALEHAIEISRETSHPLLKRIYAYTYQSDPEEPGEDRIPVPWSDDEDE